MSSKYKLKKDHGFNPFKNKLIQSLNLHMSKHYEQNPNKMNCKQFAIIINDNNIDKRSQTDKKGAYIHQQMEIHEQKCQQTQMKKLIMFNERQFCQKQFKQIYHSNEIKQTPTQFIKDFCTKSNVTNSQQQQQNSKSKMIVYLSNSRQFSQQLIIGHNQTSQNTLLEEIFNQMQDVKNKRFQQQQEQQKSQIYFSVVGIKKENQLYDLLNDRHLQVSQQGNDHEKSNLKSVPKVRVRKVGTDIDSVSAENLIKQPIKDKKHFTQLIKKSLLIKNHKMSFHNFNQSFLIGEVYHFIQANKTFDILNETVFMKVNQSLVNEVKYEDGFYQRRMKEDNTSKVASLLMRIGLNVKNCRKNRSIIEQTNTQNTSKLSKMQMHESKILLYLSPLFSNPKISYILVNQIDPKLAIQEIVRKLQLNRSFVSHEKGKKSFKEKSFCYVKHYLDNQNVLAVVKRLAVEFLPHQQEIGKTKKDSTLVKRQNPSQKRNFSSSQINNSKQILTQIINQKPILSHRSNPKSERTINSTNPQIKKKKYSNEKIKSKSFFSQTIISAQRNYLKFKQRQNRINAKLMEYNQQKVQGFQQQEYFSKTINQRVQNLKFVQENYLTSYKPIGIRISYKRKMVVKKAQQGLGNCTLN